jgi:osmotically-inducible protein OsmY
VKILDRKFYIFRGSFVIVVFSKDGLEWAMLIFGGKMIKSVSNKKNEDDLLIDVIKERIKWDSRLSNSDVIIRIENGKVIVTGIFENSNRRKAIQQILRTTKGITKFADYTQVVPGRRKTDKEIFKILTKKIKDFYLFEGEFVDIKVSQGEVLYQGVVFRKNLKAFASRMAWELSGVNDCTNLIKIKNPPIKKSGAYYIALPGAA